MSIVQCTSVSRIRFVSASSLRLSENLINMNLIRRWKSFTVCSAQPFRHCIPYRIDATSTSHEQQTIYHKLFEILAARMCSLYYNVLSTKRISIWNRMCKRKLCWHMAHALPFNGHMSCFFFSPFFHAFFYHISHSVFNKALDNNGRGFPMSLFRYETRSVIQKRTEWKKNEETKRMMEKRT